MGEENLEGEKTSYDVDAGGAGAENRSVGHSSAVRFHYLESRHFQCRIRLI
jgi:hypothetical protein